MREAIPTKNAFVMSIEPSTNGAGIRLNGRIVAEVFGDSKVVANLQTMFGEVHVYADMGIVLEELIKQSVLSRSGWNEVVPGDVVAPAVAEESGVLAKTVAEEPAVEDKGLLARMTQTVKDWFA